MTEHDWLTSTDPAAMLGHVRGKMSDRKLRLWVEACREEWAKNSKHPIAWAINFDDRIGALRGCVDSWSNKAEWTPHLSGSDRAHLLRCIVGNPWVVIGKRWGDGFSSRPRTLRPGERLLEIDKRWLTQRVVSMAETIYAERAFEDMPILADMLQEAGCDDEDVLRWLREEERCGACVGNGGYVYNPHGSHGFGHYPCGKCNGTGWRKRGATVRGDWCLDVLTGRGK